VDNFVKKEFLSVILPERGSCYCLAHKLLNKWQCLPSNWGIKLTDPSPKINLGHSGNDLGVAHDFFKLSGFHFDLAFNSYRFLAFKVFV
jgi:hypothetical protein